MMMVMMMTMMMMVVVVIVLLLLLMAPSTIMILIRILIQPAFLDEIVVKIRLLSIDLFLVYEELHCIKRSYILDSRNFRYVCACDQ
ncbi:unnamed protein product [Gongylonema pulchrum]|uniref:Secreted protein n=1 Tax=Gongylonema pulchrum TaxID=637853 RepID=A0A183CWE1_9BILA|nr:unnamed protein product [Gongylonema pulchrum]